MHEPTPRLVTQGNLVLAIDVSPKRGNPNPVPRSECKGFSASARRSMIQQCAKMGKAIPVFITLTYGKSYPSDPAAWKNDLHKWGKRLIRYNPELSAIWRLEPQKRGAPHFHLLVYQSNKKKPFIPKEWVAASWAGCLGEYSDEDHLKAGTRIESLRSSRGAAFYCAKYCAKLPDDGDFPPEWDRAGRLWGSFNKKKLKEAEAPQHEMVLHSGLEQKATLFAMKDAYKKSFIAKRKVQYEKQGEKCPLWASELAQNDWNEAVKDNEYLGNTTTFYGDATDFMKALSAKVCMLELALAKKLGRDPDPSVIDSLAAKF